MRIYEFILKLIKCIKYYRRLEIEERDNKLTERKLISLAPSTNAKFINDYYDYLHNAIYETDINGKRKNKIIGILGNFDTGKSSIINTYLRKDKILDKTSYVYMGEYESNKEKKEIEKVILQQIIYSDNNRLPNSQIDRIKLNNSTLSRIGKTIIITGLLLGIFVLFNFDGLNKLLADKKFLMIFIVVILFCLIIIYNFLPHLSKLFSKSKISIGMLDLEISNENNNKSSLLDKNIDELVYFFTNVDKEIVVFEDLDRLDSVILNDLLTSLKYINTIINIALPNKSVQFIYSIRDTVFIDLNNLYKYFDVPISILPFSSYATSYELLKETLADNDLDMYLFEVSSYLNGAREVYAVVNQYKIFKDNCDDSEKVKCLFLALYKVLYSKRFNNLYDQKGILSYYLSNEFKDTVKDLYVKEKNNKIDKEIEMIKKTHISNIKPYVDRFFNRIDQYNSDYNQIYNGDIYVTSLDEIKEDYNNIYKIRKINIRLLDSYGRVLGDEDIFDNIKKENFFTAIDNASVLNEISNLNSNKILDVVFSDIPKEYVLRNLNKLNKDIISNSKYFLENSDENNKLNSLEKVLIEKDIVDMFTMNIISKRHNKDITNNDLVIMKKMYLREKQDFNTIITNCDYVLSRINKSDFTLDSFCIIDLYCEVLKRKNYEEYLDYSCSNITEYKLKFFVELYMKKPNLFKFLKKYYDKIWLTIVGSNLDEKIINIYIVNTLINLDDNNIPRSFLRMISNYKNILYLLEDNYDSVINSLKYINIKFSSSIDYNAKNKKTIKYIFDNNMYDVSIRTYESICTVLNQPFDKEKLIDSLYSIKDNSLKKNLIRDFDQLVYELENSEVKQYSSDKSITCMFNNTELSDDLKRRLLELQDTKINDISNINDEYYSKLFELNKLDINWNNIYCLFKSKKSLSNEEVQFILNNIDKLNEDNTAFNNYNGLAYQLCSHNELDNQDYEKFVKLTKDKNRVFNTIPNVSNEKINKLIKYHILKLNNKDDLRSLLDKTDIELKNVLISDNYKELIDDDHEFFKDGNELRMLLDTNIDHDLKVEYAIECINNNIAYKTEDLLSSIYDTVNLYDVTINDNDFIINDLLTLDKSFDSKIRLFLKYCDNKDFDINLALRTIGGTAEKICEKHKPLYIAINELNAMFLDKLVDLQLIAYYNKKVKVYHIIYN